MFSLELAVAKWRDDLAKEGSLSRKDLDELEDHLRFSYEAYIAGGLQPALAFESARDDIGTPAELFAEFSKMDDPLWRRLMTAGWSAFLVSFFLPVHKYGISLFKTDIFSGDVPGFEAFVYSVTGESGLIGTLSALTNLLLIGTMWKIADYGRTGIFTWTGIIMAATLLNLWWITEGIADLRPGYYLWCASFGTVASGLFLRARELAVAPATVPAG